MAVWLYYLCAVGLLAGNCLAWFATLLTLPGNWLICGLAALFAWLVQSGQGHGVSWTIVAVLVAMAAVGEIIEFLASAAGAAKQGASRRAVALSVIGAVIGSAVGIVVGTPIPVVGSAVAAILGGGVGAFLGAYLGEQWKGRSLEQSINVSGAAMVGRLWGTVGKLVVGVIMIVVVTADSLL